MFRSKKIVRYEVVVDPKFSHLYDLQSLFITTEDWGKWIQDNYINAINIQPVVVYEKICLEPKKGELIVWCNG